MHGTDPRAFPSAELGGRELATRASWHVRLRQYRSVLVKVPLASLVLAQPVVAQTRDFAPRRPLPHRSLTFALRPVDFSFTGSETAEVVLDHKALLVGGILEMPFWRGMARISVAYGSQTGAGTGPSPDLTILDAELLAWQGLNLAPPTATQIMLQFPLLFSYRRIEAKQTSVERDDVGIFRIGVGLGLGLRQRASSKVVLGLRSAPIVNMTVKGRQRDHLLPEARVTWDSDLELHFERLFGARAGLTIGVGVRYQTWALVVDEFFPGSTAEWFSYESLEPLVRIGVHW